MGVFGEDISRNVDLRNISTDPDKRDELWETYVLEKYGVYYADDHEIMLNNFINEIAAALYELNGSNLTIDHYKYQVWLGLEVYFQDRPELTPTDVNQWEVLHNELINSNPFSDILSNC